MIRCLLTGFCLLGIGVAVLAQSRTITGKIVAGQDGSSLSGVNILLKGSSTGTTTDSEGNFTILAPHSPSTLIIRFIGFITQEIAVDNQSFVRVSLQPDVKALNEIVVVGYGTQQKNAFTGSASRIEADQFTNLLSPAIDKLLAGRATGVQVTNSGGAVNAPARIRIRGINSLNQSNDPLIVLDGIPIISGSPGTGNVSPSNALGDINPADIERMEILKDGSATAIYGSRAAAGVILITTKKGVKGKTRVTYDGFLGFSNALKKYDVLNTREFTEIANEKRRNAGLSDLAGTNSAERVYDTDWQAEIMVRNTPVHNHNLRVQGGSERLSYYMSVNYSDQKGVIISNSNKSYRARLNLDYAINPWVRVGNNLGVSRQLDTDGNNNPKGLGGAIASSLRLPPNVSPYSASHASGYNINYPHSGSMTPGSNAQTVDDNFSNVAYTQRANKYKSDKYRIINNLFLEASPLKGLTVRTQVGTDVFAEYAYMGLNMFHGDGYGIGSNFNESQNQLRLVWSNYFNYNFSIGRHHVFITGGNEVQKETHKWFSAMAKAISDPFFIGDNVISGTAENQSIDGNYDRTGFTSLFGRINYDFGNRYFMQASLRRDGQSALTPGHRYGVFPGFSIGWRPSEENFWTRSPFLHKWVNDLKLKASYAKVGNTLWGYPYLSTYGSSPYGNLSGIHTTGVGNSDLKWETSSKYDIGIEAGIDNNRFIFSADWFLNDVNHLVLGVPTPLSAGIPGSTDTRGGEIFQNVGNLENRGIELSLDATIIREGGFTWDMSLNYSKVKNKIISLYAVGDDPVSRIENGAYNIVRVGDPVNIIYGYRYAGVNSANGNAMFYKADGSLIQYNTIRGQGVVGVFYTAGSGSDGELGQVSSLTSADKTNLGQGIPTWFGAFTNHFRYKGFALEVMLRYSGGNKIMNFTRQEILSNQSFQNNGKEILDRWTTPGQITDVPRLYYGLAENMNSNGSASSRWVESGDYLKLQNVVFSYTFNPQTLQSRTKGYLTALRLFAQGQNLHAWTRYKGSDPDNISALGVDASISPQLKIISFGLSVGI